MEDVLDLYAEPYDPSRPQVCFDEKLLQLIAETRRSLPMEPGKPERFDTEYQRNGTRNLFIFFQPLTGWRHIKVTPRRTNIDYAHCMKDLVDVHFPQAQVIRVVQDNLNTHSPASLYEAFEPAEAKRILDRLEFHYTPKHGSWLNMAEIELAVLSRQCLDERIPDEPTLLAQVTPWEVQRNQLKATVTWRFTATDARVKLKRLYPS